MGANAQTSVPTFTAGEVLTAANMNISARTGVPVFADTTARDAGFGGTGEKTLAEGQLCYLESTNVVQYYDGAAWATVGPTTVSSALTLISSTTIGSAVSSVTVSSAFSSTYDNYLILLTGGVASANGQGKMTLGSTATGYSYGYTSTDYNGGAAQSAGGDNVTEWARAWTHRTDQLNAHITLMAPNLAKITSIIAFSGSPASGSGSLLTTGALVNTTQYTAFTMTPNSGTLTGGTIRVYGYANS